MKNSWVLAVAFLLAMGLALSAPSLAKARKHKPPVQPKAATQPNDAHYIAGLATANRFLAAWQSNDQPAALPLLTKRAKQQSTEEGVDQFFSGSSLRGFEITHGLALRPGRYQFPIVLLQVDDAGHTHRRMSDVIVTNTGGNDWAVDRLP